jgi:hypothetical protein
MGSHYKTQWKREEYRGSNFSAQAHAIVLPLPLLCRLPDFEKGSKI